MKWLTGRMYSQLYKNIYKLNQKNMYINCIELQKKTYKHISNTQFSWQKYKSIETKAVQLDKQIHCIIAYRTRPKEGGLSCKKIC